MSFVLLIQSRSPLVDKNGQLLPEWQRLFSKATVLESQNNQIGDLLGIGVSPLADLDVGGNGQIVIRAGNGGALPSAAGKVLKLECISGTGNIQVFDYGASVAHVLALNAGGGNVAIGKSTTASTLGVAGLPVFANNAAAITGGLAAGDFYRTGADPDPVCVVH